MARRRKRSGVSITLFPFLNVLACAMGVLIVIISGQNILAIGTSDQIIEISDPQDVDDNGSVIEGGEERKRQAVYVECGREGIIIHPKGTRVSMASLKDLEEKGGIGRFTRPPSPRDLGDRKDDDQVSPLARPSRGDREELAAYRERLAAYRERVAAYRAKLVELHPCPFDRLLVELKTIDKNRYPVLLIRPNGIESYEVCESIITARELPVGKDALLGGGRLIFASAKLVKIGPVKENER